MFTGGLRLCFFGGLGFRAWGLGLRDWGLGLRVSLGVVFCIRAPKRNHEIDQTRESMKLCWGVEISSTLPETNMETQKGSIKTTVLVKGGYMGFHVSLGECNPCRIRQKDPHRLLTARGLGFRVLGFRVLGFRVLGFRVLGFRVLGFRVLGFRGTFLGVPIIRTIVFRGPYWGPPILGNYPCIPRAPFFLRS